MRLDTSATAVLFVAAAFFAMFALRHVACAAAQPGIMVYSNAETGLRFEYQADYVLKETLTPDGKLIFILIGVKEGINDGQRPRWLLDISVSDSGTYPSAAYGGERPTVSARQFALEEARNHCAADGDDGGVRCEEAVEVNDFISARGLAGIEIYLREISTHYDEDGGETSEESVKGPIYAFDISRGQSVKLLMAEPVFHEIKSREELEAVKVIIGHFRIEPAQK